MAKILIVDDKLDQRLLMRKYCQKIFGEGCRISEASDGLLAFQQVSEGSGFDLIITDRHMPNCDGIEFITLLKGFGHDQPIIMATTEQERKNIVEAIQLQIADYLIKPYSFEAFKEKVEKHCLNS